MMQREYLKPYALQQMKVPGHGRRAAEYRAPFMHSDVQGTHPHQAA
jgi:hypothetical protein